MKKLLLTFLLFPLIVTAQPHSGPYPQPGGSGGSATNAISSISGPKLTAVYVTNNGAISATVSILPDAEYSYNPVFVSVARGNDSTAVKYRYDLPYATLTNAYAACTNTGDLMYVLDGSFNFAGTAPTLQGFAEVFVASGVTITNYTFEPTNLLFIGGPVWHIYGQGVFAADQSDVHNAFCYLNNNPGNASTNSSITVVVSAKGIYFPTNVPCIVLGRSSNWTNYCYVTCSDVFNGSIEDDNGGANNSSSFCNVTAPTIFTGAGSSVVGVQGSAFDQTNRFWSFNGRNMTLAQTGSAILFDFCTLIFGNGLLIDLRPTSANAKKQQIVLNGTHFAGPTSMSGNPYFGTFTVDGVAPSVGYFGPTNYIPLANITNLTTSLLTGPTNNAVHTTITPSGLNTIGLNLGWTNNLGARADIVLAVFQQVGLTNMLVLTNTTTGECYSNSLMSGNGSGTTNCLIITYPDISPNDQGTLSNYPFVGSVTPIITAKWKLK